MSMTTLMPAKKLKDSEVGRLGIGGHLDVLMTCHDLCVLKLKTHPLKQTPAIPLKTGGWLVGITENNLGLDASS